MKQLLNAQKKGCDILKTRVAVISIIIENKDSIETLNHLLHEASEYIIGRMGIPYRQKGISIISIAIDAPQDTISTLSGKIGRLKGVSAKTAYSNVITQIEADVVQDVHNADIHIASSNPANSLNDITSSKNGAIW